MSANSLIALPSIIHEVIIISIVYRQWRTFRRDQTVDAVSLSTLLRVIIFSLYRVVVAVYVLVTFTPRVCYLIF